MRKIALAALVGLSIVLMGVGCRACAADGKWSGVDDTVVGRFAEKAGRVPSKPLINTDQGDLLLFVFLVAGTVAGFVAGYYYREMFPPKGRRDKADV